VAILVIEQYCVFALNLEGHAPISDPRYRILPCMIASQWPANHHTFYLRSTIVSNRARCSAGFQPATTQVKPRNNQSVWGAIAIPPSDGFRTQGYFFFGYPIPRNALWLPYAGCSAPI